MGKDKKEDEKEFDIKDMWEYYEVELRVLDRLYGGMPKDPNLIDGFLAGKGLPPMVAKPIAKKAKKEIDKSLPDDKPDGENIERSWTCFKKDKKGLYIETRQVKAMLKEACSASELWKQVSGLRSRIGDTLFPKGEGVDGTKIYLLTADGSVYREPSGFEQNPARVKGPQGERSIIKIKDYVDAPVVRFDLKVGGSKVNKKILDYLFEYGTEIGLGADRTCERGKFVVAKLDKKK